MRAWPVFDALAWVGESADTGWVLGDCSSELFAVSVPGHDRVRRLPLYADELEATWRSTNGTTWLLTTSDDGLLRFEGGEFTRPKGRAVRGSFLTGTSGATSREDVLWVLSGDDDEPAVLQVRAAGRWSRVKLGDDVPTALTSFGEEALLALRAQAFDGPPRLLRWSGSGSHRAPAGR
jgi:hypothetical protein